MPFTVERCAWMNAASYEAIARLFSLKIHTQLRHKNSLLSRKATLCSAYYALKSPRKTSAQWLANIGGSERETWTVFFLPASGRHGLTVQKKTIMLLLEDRLGGISSVEGGSRNWDCGHCVFHSSFCLAPPFHLCWCVLWKLLKVNNKKQTIFSYLFALFKTFWLFAIMTN